MKKALTLIVLSIFILAGCESAFKLPEGCEEELPADTQSPAGVEDTVVSAPQTEKTDLKESSSVSEADSEKLPVKTVVEGDVVSFPNLKATDFDGDKITYTFSEPLDKNGKWNTKVGDAGEYFVAITASDGKSKASQKVKIVVLAKNRPPVVQLQDSITVNEGETVKLSPVVTDAENDEVTVTFSGWMDGNEKTTKFGDAGKYVVAVKASDGTSSVTRKVNVVVKKVNRAPEIEAITDIAIKEGDKITVKPVAKDPDKDKLSFEFSKPLDASGVWQTKLEDAGTYNLSVTVSDGDLTATASFKVTVEAINRPPVLTVNEVEINVDEGDVVTIHAETTDADNDPVRTSFSGWMTSDSYKTTFEDSGVHTVTVTATDGINTVSKDVQVTVRNVNRAPVFDAGSFD